MPKNSSVLGGIAVGALFVTAAYADPPEVDPGDLPDFFAGTWTIRGAETTFNETCSWLSPNSYLICKGVDANPEAPETWIRLMGYSHSENTYNLSVFAGDGGKIMMTGWLDGDVWKFVGENKIFHRATGVDVLRRQESMTPTKDGYNLKAEVSVNGEPWRVVLEDEFIRVK